MEHNVGHSTEKISEVATTAKTIADSSARYQTAAMNFPNLPWYVIGILHSMECACNFKIHLHNGDPLTARTVHDPKNRPPIWDPSWEWEKSAQDAITYDRLDQVENWTLPRILYTFERYNGIVLRRRFGKATPDRRSYSNHYVRGKYVADCSGGILKPIPKQVLARLSC